MQEAPEPLKYLITLISLIMCTQRARAYAYSV